MPASTVATRLLEHWSGGHRDAIGELRTLRSNPLRDYAYSLRREHDVSISTTARVHEPYLRLDEAFSRMDERGLRASLTHEHPCFGGRTARESAAVLGLARATVEQDLHAARAGLAREWAQEPLTGLAPAP